MSEASPGDGYVKPKPQWRAGANAVGRTSEARARLALLVSLAVLNAADVLLTRAVLSHDSAHEANPAAAHLLAAGTLLPSKVRVLGLLALLVATVPLHRRWVAWALCLPVGAYAAVVVINLTNLARV